MSRSYQHILLASRPLIDVADPSGGVVRSRGGWVLSHCDWGSSAPSRVTQVGFLECWLGWWGGGLRLWASEVVCV